MIFVNGRFIGRKITGVQRYAIEVLKQLEGEVSVISPSTPLTGFNGHLWEQFLLKSKVRKGVLWSPCNTGPLSVKNQVLTLHDCSFIDEPEGFSRSFRSFYQWLIPRLLKKVKHVITVSEFSSYRIQRNFGISENQISVIPEGADASFCPQPAEKITEVLQKLGIKGSYLLGLGSLEPRKNLAQLLKVWAKMGEEKKGVTLVLVGEGNSQVFSEALLKNQTKDVLFTGYIPDKYLPALYSGARAFVYPSFYEGFGLPVLEAMSCGTLVLCSKTSALPEVTGGAALHFDPQIDASLEAGLQMVLRGKAPREIFIKKGLAQAAKFSWDKCAHEVLSVLENV